MEQTQSKSPLIFFAGVLILGIAAVFLLISKCSTERANSDNGSTSTENSGKSKPNDVADGYGIGEGPSDPGDTAEALIGQISEVALQANSTKNAQALIDIIGEHKLTPAQIRKLSELAASSRLQLNQSEGFSRVPGTGTQRWSLNLADNTKIYIDLSKTAEGKWQVSHITLPETRTAARDDAGDPTKPGNPDNPAGADKDEAAAVMVQRFMDAIIRLDPAAARHYIDASKISYATLAGLCIIFEEGDYSLIEEKALRKMFHRETASGWLVQLRSKDTGDRSVFAINSKRKDTQSAWKITEINLDNILADYAKRILGGDIHYSPLIKNPEGGDTLAIYFDLDAKDLIPRTKRQLVIVANLLKTDADKKLTISGHADALGSDPYNLTLSRDRAEQVMQFLAENGVGQEQMNIKGYGRSKPRLPNTTKEGADFPEGRRANRRAEILLDF